MSISNFISTLFKHPIATAAVKAVKDLGGGGKVDVQQVMDKIYEEGQKKGLDCKNSIVDLMKFLGLNHDIDERKKLAKELHYEGNTEDTAEMNDFLHKEMEQKIAASGGHLPDSFGHKA